MVAAWMQQPGEALGAVWESQIVCRLGANEEVIVGHGQFTFTGLIQRIQLDGFFNPVPGFPSQGVLEVTCRIRPVGQETWSSQTYPIIVDVVEPPAQPEPSVQAIERTPRS
jgi:hypothetical protein